jgi:hypothetical protein
MKKYESIMSLLLILFMCGCVHTDEKINKYIQTHCSFEVGDTCYIDLRKVFKVDYDTMYLFNDFTILDAIQNCLGSKSFEPKRPFKIMAIEYNVYSVVLMKNGKIVYNDYKKYYGSSTIEYGTPICIQGEFDGNIIIDTAYLYSSSVFKVVRQRNDTDQKKSFHYMLEEVQKK